MPSPETRAFDRRSLLGAALAGMWVRFLPFQALTAEGQRLASMDDYGHLRRVAATLVDLPWVPVFDPFLAHPEGGIWIWPPLFDLMIALPVAALFGRNADLTEIAAVASLVPPLLGVISLLPLFAFVARTLGRTEAHVSVWIYALLPAAVVWSSYGHADQHCAEALGLLVVLAAGSRLLGEAPEQPARWKSIAPLALAFAFAVLVWQGAIFAAVIVAAAGWLAGRARPLARALVLAGVLVLPFAVGHPGPVTYVSFGAFQPLFLLLIAALLALTTLQRFGLAAATLAGLLAVVLWPPLGNGVLHLLSATQGGEIRAGGYLSYPVSWLRLIAEYRPLWTQPLSRTLGSLSLGLLALPIMLGVWTGQLFGSERAGRGPRLLLVLASMVVLLMTLAQQRYVYYLVIFVAIALAAFALWLARRLDKSWVAAVVVVLALLPIVGALWALRSTHGAAGADIFETLAELQRLDPPARDPRQVSRIEPGEIEGVLAPWSLGHLVTLFSGRPAVADNFGYGFVRQARVYAATPEMDEDVGRWLVEWKVRYVLTTDILGPVLPRYAEAVGLPPGVQGQTWAERIHSSRARNPLPYLTLVLTSRSGTVDPSGNFRPRLKIWRVLPPDARDATRR